MQSACFSSKFFPSIGYIEHLVSSPHPCTLPLPRRPLRHCPCMELALGTAHTSPSTPLAESAARRQNHASEPISIHWKRASFVCCVGACWCGGTCGACGICRCGGACGACAGGVARHTLTELKGLKLTDAPVCGRSGDRSSCANLLTDLLTERIGAGLPCTLGSLGDLSAVSRASKPRISTVRNFPD